MLYDPKWEVKANPISIEGLIAWLEMQPPGVRYDYDNCRGECLVGRYFLHVFGADVFSARKERPMFSEVFKSDLYLYHQVASTQPWTYGAALERARAASQS